MNLCALILAHQKLSLLSRLTKRLAKARISLFVHVDAKMDLSPFRDACAGTGSIFVHDRVDVFWGGYSMIEATLALARQALSESDASHFLYISGDTYPIQSDQNVLSYLLRDYDFIDTEEFQQGSSTYQRIAKTYLPDTRVGALRAMINHEERHLDAEYFAHVHRVEHAYALKKRRVFPLRYAKGSNWWCLRRCTMEKCISIIENSEITEWFRYSANPDESLFNTLTLNYFNQDRVLPCPVYTIWNRSERPYEFRHLSDLPLLRDTALPFARKFSEGAASLLDAVEALDCPQHAFRSSLFAGVRTAVRAARSRWSLPSLFNPK